jgi:O-antigen/teichoic acid export membrane protein
MLVVTLPFCFLIDWGKVFHIHGSQHYAAAGPALAILVTSFFLGFPLTGAQRLTSAFQVGWMSSIKNVAAGILTLAAIGLAVWWKLNFLAFMLVVVLPPIIGNVVLLIVFFRQSRWSLESLRLIDRNSAKLLLRQNWLFMLPTIGATILGVAPAVLISGILGASALTPYNLALKLLSLFALVQAMLLGPLWPAYAEAKARGDVGWISATYKKSLWMTFLFSVMPTLSFSIWGRWALHIWSRNPIGSFDPWLIFLLCVWTAISSYSQTVALLLNALHKIKGQASYGLASVCLALAIMPACINKWGIAGAPMSLVCIFGLVALPLVCWEGHFQLKALIKLSNLTSEAGEIKNT